MISLQASVSKGWLHKYGNFVFSEKYYLDPVYRHFLDKEINDFVRTKFLHYPVYHMEANLMQAAFVEENQILVGGIQPNLILAIASGAEFISYPDKDADVNGIPLKNISKAGDLPSTEKILNHPYIIALDSQITQIQNNHSEWKIIPPFFWDSSGRATIHGILTTSLKLIGEKSMLMIMVDPELLHVIHQWITEVYIALINHFAHSTDFSITSVHVGECSGTMISNEQYKEFITPYVSQFGKRFGNTCV